MIENIRESLGEDVLDNVLLTADTGYSSEENMKYLYDEKIDAVVPDTLHRQRDPRIARSESVAKHKNYRQLTRKDKANNTVKIPASEFCFNEEALSCVCPGGYEMMYHGGHFEINNKKYHRFKSMLKNYRGCPLQSECMKRPLK